MFTKPRLNLEEAGIFTILYRFGKIFNLIIASMIIFQVVTFGALVVVGAQVSNQVSKIPNILGI